MWTCVGPKKRHYVFFFIIPLVEDGVVMKKKNGGADSDTDSSMVTWNRDGNQQQTRAELVKAAVR